MLRIHGTSKRFSKSVQCPRSALGILIAYCVRISPVIESQKSRSGREGPAASGRMTILLASNSPRRRELMGLGNRPFDVLVTDVDESERPGESPADYVLRLAEAKAHAAVPRAQSYIAIVAADTTVVDDSAILGKPRDPAEAVQMLKQFARACASGLHGPGCSAHGHRSVAEGPLHNRCPDAATIAMPRSIDTSPPAIRSIKLAPMPYNMPSSIQSSDNRLLRFRHGPAALPPCCGSSKRSALPGKMISPHGAKRT